MQILNALAALCRGQSPEVLSSMIARSERNLWPVHLKSYLRASHQDDDSVSFADTRPEDQEVAPADSNTLKPARCLYTIAIGSNGTVACLAACNFVNTNSAAASDAKSISINEY